MLLRPNRVGLVFAGGMTIASALLALTAVPNYWVVLAALLGANFCGNLFGACQATLVMLAVPKGQQGVAMGVVTMAIAAQAVGMNLIGAVASATSAVRLPHPPL